MRYHMEQWIGHWIKRIHRDMTNMHDRLLSEHGLTTSQVGVLAALWEQDGRTQKELHEQLGIRAASLSNMLDTLVANGFVVRRPDPQDARVKRVFLTEAGRSVEDTCLKSVHHMESILQAGFTAEELSLLVSWLRRLHGNVDDGYRGG